MLTARHAPTDHDGMPDVWETAQGLNPNNAADRNTVASNGYTNLENYLNEKYDVRNLIWPISYTKNPCTEPNLSQWDYNG